MQRYSILDGTRKGVTCNNFLLHVSLVFMRLVIGLRINISNNLFSKKKKKTFLIIWLSKKTFLIILEKLFVAPTVQSVLGNLKIVSYNKIMF